MDEEKELAEAVRRFRRALMQEQKLYSAFVASIQGAVTEYIRDTKELRPSDSLANRIARRVIGIEEE